MKEKPEISKNLPRDILDKSTNMVNTVDKIHKADAEEDTTETTLNKYIHNLEDTHGPLTKKVQEIDRRNNIFEELAIEADEIKTNKNIL